MDLLLYCAEEVERQGDRPLAVFWMASAWFKAVGHSVAKFEISPALIEEWGKLVSPEKNEGGFRNCWVRVGNHTPPQPAMVRPMVGQLCANIRLGLEPASAYKEFQEIHPFRDGNGRTGKILFNYMKGTLLDPVMPPNFFGCSNP